MCKAHFQIGYPKVSCVEINRLDQHTCTIVSQQHIIVFLDDVVVGILHAKGLVAHKL